MILKPKQERFCMEYLVDNNATQAAIRAGYSPKAASQESSRLLKHPEVRARIEENKKKLMSDVEITASFVLKGIKDIAETGERDNDKLKAFELLGKHLKLFSENLNINGNMNVQIIDNINDFEDEEDDDLDDD